MVITKLGRILTIFFKHLNYAFVIFFRINALGNTLSLLVIPALCFILLELAGHLVVKLCLVKESELMHWEELR